MVEFVAEVGSNHRGNLERCLAFIEKAASIGCDFVKFQLFQVNRLFAPEILARSEAHRGRVAWELPGDFLGELARHCHDLGLGFGCTPFYLEAVEKLYPYVDFYKISSYDLLRQDLLCECARTGKRLIVSTGMATLDEVNTAVEVLRHGGCREVVLLHCVSAYPASPHECNLSAIKTLRQNTGCPVGWSDHTVEPAVIYRAVHRWGASVIEFHLDLDGEGPEYAIGHCWLPEQIAPVIKAIRLGFAADGSGAKVPAPGEMREREWRADPEDGLRPLRPARRLWEFQSAGSPDTDAGV